MSSKDEPYPETNATPDELRPSAFLRLLEKLHDDAEELGLYCAAGVIDTGPSKGRVVALLRSGDLQAVIPIEEAPRIAERLEARHQVSGCDVCGFMGESLRELLGRVAASAPPVTPTVH